MKVKEVISAWGYTLRGKTPSLSIEITRECPLRCPGCYAYEDQHLGGNGVLLRTLADHKGDDLVTRVLEVVDRIKPLHLSIVGEDRLGRIAKSRNSYRCLPPSRAIFTCKLLPAPSAC